MYVKILLVWTHILHKDAKIGTLSLLQNAKIYVFKVINFFCCFVNNWDRILIKLNASL